MYDCLLLILLLTFNAGQIPVFLTEANLKHEAFDFSDPTDQMGWILHGRKCY